MTASASKYETPNFFLNMANTSSVFETFIKSIAKLRREEDQRSEGDDKYEYGAVETYLTQDKVGTMDMSHYFFPLFFASEKGPLGIWEKQVGGQFFLRIFFAQIFA